ncbi:DUF2795 domain-containing protein [Streptomyces sp. NPDC018031]|uniref:DUF2795 domain-containing protein n=1 Tax=Streptomyces sp. NPDC018031 TaxID=3365033 RepID=UPI00379A6B5A
MQSCANSAPDGVRHPANAAKWPDDGPPRPAGPARHRRLRQLCGAFLVALTIVLAPLGVVAVWVSTQITDTDRYVKTVAPIATEPAVQRELTDRLTAWVADTVDDEKATAALADTLRRNGAPPAVVEQARALPEARDAGVAEVVHGVVEKAVTSDQFAGAWETANRRVHPAIVQVLTGKGGSAVETRGGTITLDLGTVLDEVRRELAAAGFETGPIPHVDKSVVLVQTDELDEAQTLMRLLDTLGAGLPVLVVLLGALAVRVFPAHRAALAAVGAGVALMMLALLVTLDLLRQTYLDSVPADTQPQDAAAAVYDSLLRFLRDATRVTLVAATVVVALAFAGPPGRRGRAPRRSRAGTAASRGSRRGPGRAGGLTAVGAAAAALALLGVLAAARTAPGPSAAGSAHPRHTPGPTGRCAGPVGRAEAPREQRDRLVPRAGRTIHPAPAQGAGGPGRPVGPLLVRPLPRC